MLLTLVAVLAGCEITAKTASPDPVTKGEDLTFTIDVSFDQGDLATFVEDKLPDSVRFVSASEGCEFIAADNTVRCFVQNPNGQEAGTTSVTIVVTPTECGTFTNTAVIAFPEIPAESALEQLSTEQRQNVEERLQELQLSTEDLMAAGIEVQPSEKSVDFTVVGCEQPEPRPEPQPAGAAPITQEFDQESEAGEIDQSFEVS